MSFDLSSSFPHFKIPMANGGNNGIYEFDQFKLDAGKLMLYRRDEEITLPPKVVKTLAVLVENGNEILSKDDLIEQVWPDSIVEEASLSQHLYLLRKTLGTKQDGQPYIETLRRRGYRFTGDVRCLPNGKTSSARRAEPEPRTPSFDVEREGNVLRLVDWRPNEEPAAAASTAPPIEISQTPDLRILAWIAIAFLLGATIVTAIVLVNQDRPDQRTVASKGEISVTRLTNGNIPLNLAITGDGDFFVYDENDGEISRMWMQQVGQSGRVEIFSSSNLLLGGKTFSSDGKFVYFIGSDKVRHVPELYRLPSMGGPPTKLISGVVGPVSFSPDGEELVFLHQKLDSEESALVIADKDGRNERILRRATAPRRITSPPSWSPDGRIVAFSENDLSSHEGLSLLGIDPVDGSLRELSQEKWATVHRIAWTHKGDGFAMIATRLNEGLSTRRDVVYFVSYPAGESLRLTSDGNRHQVWSMGMTEDDAIIAAPFSRSSHIWSVDLSSEPRSDSKQISTGLSDGRAGLAPIPDGRVGYIARIGEMVSIWIMNADGSGAKQITSDPPVMEELRADPHGRYFIFSAPSGNQSHLFRINTDGSDLRQLTAGDGSEGDSAVSPDGNWVLYASSVFRDRLRSELWKVPIDGGEPVRFSDEECASPHYSPGGSLVSCVRDEKEILVLSAVDGKKLESYRVLSHSSVNYGVVWTPDESGLTFLRSLKGVSNLWVMTRSPGATPVQITQFTGGFISRHAYSADGSRLYLARGYPTSDAILISNFR